MGCARTNYLESRHSGGHPVTVGCAQNVHYALVQAMDRRDEVFQMIEDSDDADEAMRRVGQLLGVGELGSRPVLDVPEKDARY
jgi:hypothetical protein